MVFPISDYMHFLVGAMPAIILFVFLTYKLGQKMPKKLKIFGVEFFKIFTKLIAILVTIIFLRINYLYLKECSQYTKINHFKYIPCYREDIKIVDKYITEIETTGKKVYILDASACVYMIPIDRYNKNYDMFLKGALGSKGEKGQIENLENEKNAQILIRKSIYNRNWQNPEEVREYIVSNWEKTGEIYIFDIYENTKRE